MHLSMRLTHAQRAGQWSGTRSDPRGLNSPDQSTTYEHSEFVGSVPEED